MPKVSRDDKSPGMNTAQDLSATGPAKNTDQCDFDSASGCGLEAGSNGSGLLELSAGDFENDGDLQWPQVSSPPAPSRRTSSEVDPRFMPVPSVPSSCPSCSSRISVSLLQNNHHYPTDPLNSETASTMHSSSLSSSSEIAGPLDIGDEDMETDSARTLRSSSSSRLSQLSSSQLSSSPTRPSSLISSASSFLADFLSDNGAWRRHHHIVKLRLWVRRVQYAMEMAKVARKNWARLRELERAASF
jgi:hypothetical protein